MEGNKKNRRKKNNYPRKNRRNYRKEPKNLRQFSSPSMWLKREIVVMTSNNKNQKRRTNKRKSKYYVCKICGTNVPAHPNIPANQMFCPRCMKPMEPM